MPPRGNPRRRRIALLAALVVCSAALAAMEMRPSGTDGSSLQVILRDLREVSYPRFAWLRSLANSMKGPVRVGLQIGHLDAALAPDELENLRQSTGGASAGLNEVDVNRAVATALAERLRERGIVVDLLSAIVPPGYRADLLLSIHADSNPNPDRRGYKSAHFRPARGPHEALLKVAVDRAYFTATGLPDDDRNVSGNMLFYYAFNHRRFEHSVHRSTPSLLVELGYLSNPDDRVWLEQPDLLAAALESGVIAYLTEIRRLH